VLTWEFIWLNFNSFIQVWTNWTKEIWFICRFKSLKQLFENEDDCSVVSCVTLFKVWKGSRSTSRRWGETLLLLGQINNWLKKRFTAVANCFLNTFVFDYIILLWMSLFPIVNLAKQHERFSSAPTCRASTFPNLK